MMANGAFWSNIFYGTAVAIPVWPYPVQFATFLTASRPLQFLVVLRGQFLVDRLVGHGLFELHPRDLRCRLRPHAAGVGVEDRAAHPHAHLCPAADGHPGGDHLVHVCLQYSGMQSIVLDATLVIAITFFGTAIAAIVLPWRQKSVFDGSPIAKYKMPTWLSWLVTLLFAAGVVYLLYLTYNYAMAVFAQWPDQTALTQAMIVVVTVLGLLNVVLLLWLAYYIIRKLLAGEKLPLVTVAGLVFFAFLDWLLVEWFWDPGYLYGIGWQNSTSMVFMIAMYVLAAVIYFGFSAYRRRQGIDVNKVYQNIPVE